jgi:glycerate kinase
MMASGPLRVVIAPDAFKGGPTAPQVADAIATGWRAERPADHLRVFALADGGEGTVDALAHAHPDATLVHVPNVTGPDGKPTDATYCRLADGTAVIELAQSSGLPKMRALDPKHATTRGLGEVIAHALDLGATRLMIGLGGSASTDAGTGALYALGLQAFDANGDPLKDGGIALQDLAHLDTSALVDPPSGGIVLLSDVSAPLTGPTGAAHVFGPQKGADAETIDALDSALARFASLAKGDPDAPGAGAAGGTGYGLATLLHATLTPGGQAIATLTGLADALTDADLVLTGEGAIDASTFTGKVVDTVWTLARANNVSVIAIGGKVAADVVATKPGLSAISTSETVGSLAQSFKDPIGAITAAAKKAAQGL